MVTVIHVPPQPAPKAKTAKTPTRNLLEHKLAFLNENNKKGFLPDGLSDSRMQTIYAELQHIAKQPKIHFRDFTAFVNSTRVNKVNPTSQTIHGGFDFAVTYNMLANLLGYKDYQAVVYYRTHDEYVFNRRNADLPLSQCFNKHDKTLIAMPLTKKAKAPIRSKQAGERLHRAPSHPMTPDAAQWLNAVRAIGQPPQKRDALYSEQLPLQDSEYFARRQLLADQITALRMGGPRKHVVQTRTPYSVRTVITPHSVGETPVTLLDSEASARYDAFCKQFMNSI